VYWSSSGVIASVSGNDVYKLYALMRSGRLDSLKDGGARFITCDALDAYVRLLQAEARQAAQDAAL
jgi:hypothetical protein